MVKLYESRAWLYKRYAVDKKTAVQMAKEAGCTKQTIYTALRKYGLM